MNRLFSYLRLCGALLLLALSGCEGVFDFKSDDKPLFGVEWDLRAFENPVGKKTDIGSEGILLSFKEDSTFEGRAYDRKKGKMVRSGNLYGGGHKVSADGSLELSRPWSTKMGTLPGSRYGEYLDALENASSYKIEGNRLCIFYNNKTNALEFKAP